MYDDEIKKVSPFRIANAIRIAESLVSERLRSNPWTILDHGRKILSTEDELNCYMAAYGEMHRAKAFYALSAVPFNELDESVEIIDYGCGQGLGSMCFIEKMREQKCLHRLRKATLIEPSKAALHRAKINLHKALEDAPNCEIVTLEQFLPSATPSDDEIKSLDVKCNIVVHLFSNVLDIATIDLKRTASLVTSSGFRHYVICVGPANCEEHRLDSFIRYFRPDGVDLLLKQRENVFGYLTNGYSYGCLAICFKFTKTQDRPILIPYSFYAPKQMFAAYELDEVEYNDTDEIQKLSAFEVLAPFDIGASIHDDVHPLLAVLSNMISRGLPTCASPFIEEEFSKKLKHSSETNELGGIRYVLNKERELSERDKDLLRKTPVAVARIEKVIIEALIIGRLSLSDDRWNVLVKENDVPCAALAFAELKQMFEHLTAIACDYDETRFPQTELTIINERYSDSPLHLGANVKKGASADCRKKGYDIVIDIAVDKYCDPSAAFSEFKAKNGCYFNIRSSRTIYAERYFYTTDRIVYKPLTQKNEKGTHNIISQNVNHLRYFLQLLFRKQDFRDGQLPILNRAMQLKSVIGLLPTGGGKSLTYQLAALLQPGITVVIDPLQSLMKDQYDGLLKNGIDGCTFINSQVSDEERRQRESLLKNSMLLFVFISPERLGILRFRNSLRAMRDAHVYFSYGVIDEVHCVSEWGHDFRFTYLHLGRNLYNYVLPKQGSHISLFGLTATASFDVLADVERELSGDNAFPLDDEATIRYENTNRLELQYKVIRIDSGGDDNKWYIYEEKNHRVSGIIRRAYNDLKVLISDEAIKNIKERFVSRENIIDEEYIKGIEESSLIPEIAPNWYEEADNQSSMIVFCPHRRGSIGVNSTGNVGIADSIEAGLGTSVSRFVGGDDLSVQDDFIQGRTNVMVATKAFGMGIDKPNIRFTIHVNHSGSLEAFVQEAGRAGRDRKMALAIILYCDRYDYDVQKFFYDGNFKGAEYEKCIMYFLMTYQRIQAEGFDANNKPFYKSVSGFLSEFATAEVGHLFISYISYAYPSEDSRRLDGMLMKHKLTTIGSGRDTIEYKAQRYLEAISKAMYRMCCIGLIDDFTQDYWKKEIRIVARKKKEGEYYENLRRFLEKYFTPERAAAEVQQATQFKGQNEIQKCLGYLTDFIYSKIAAKRKRAIDDMEDFCHEAAYSEKSWLETNEDMKDYIYYYFNSKYAREGYAVGEESFSLTDDTERGKRSSFDIVFKYMRVVDDDLLEAGATPRDNIKHLQGAIRLIRRAVTEPNPALDLLNVYCLLFLGMETNDTAKKEMEESYTEGYLEFYNRTNDKSLFYEKMTKFKQSILQRKIAGRKEVRQLDGWGVECEISLHSDWLSEFAKRYTLVPKK